MKERRSAEYRLPRALQTLPPGRWGRDAAPAILECARQAVFRATPLSSVARHIQPLATASRCRMSTLPGRGRRFRFFDFDSDSDPDSDHCHCHDPVACGAAKEFLNTEYWLLNTAFAEPTKEVLQGPPFFLFSSRSHFFVLKPAAFLALS